MNTEKNEHIACRFLISYEGKRARTGDPEPGEPVEHDWVYPMVFSKRIVRGDTEGK